MNELPDDIIIPATPGASVWVAAELWQGPSDDWPRMYRLPVIAWRIRYGVSLPLPIVVGTELDEDQPFLLESPDGPVFIGTIERGWHTACPNLADAAEVAGFPIG